MWEKFRVYKSKADNPKSSGDGNEPPVTTAVPELLFCAREPLRCPRSGSTVFV